jgi:hypothetical protein
MLEVLYIMNKNEVGEIEDIIGMLGDIEEHDVGGNGGYAEECAFRLFNIIKPYIEADIKKNGNDSIFAGDNTK